jgi:hypothetical protein
VKNFRAAGGEGVSFVVAEFVKKARLGGFVGIGGVDAVDVGPDDELIGVYDMRDDGAGKIGAVAAEGGDAAVRSCADEASNDRHDAGFEERKKNVAAALFGLFEMGLGFAKSFAGEDEFGGRYRDRRDAGLFEGGGEEPGAEAFAKGGEAIEELRAGGNAGVNRDFVKKIASQELQLAADAQVIHIAELQSVKHIEVKIQDELGFAASVGGLAIGESASNGKKMIGDALHGGDNHGDGGRAGSGANKACGMEHAVRTEERAAAELEGDNVPALLAHPPGVMHSIVQRGGAWFRCWFFLYVF